MAALDDTRLFGSHAGLTPSALHNTYVLGRHGRSVANNQGIISSGPRAFHHHGLSAVGVDEALASSSSQADRLRDAIIVASPLSRASATAAIHAEVVGARALSHDIRLRERYFGELDGKSARLYPNVWAEDVEGRSSFGVEAPERVRDRVVSLIGDLEREHRGATIVLVSHGDTAQITETWFRGIEATRHRELTPMQTAELRAMTP